MVWSHYSIATFRGWFTDKRSKWGEEVSSGWPSAGSAWDETEEVEQDTAASLAEGF